MCGCMHPSQLTLKQCWLEHLNPEGYMLKVISQLMKLRCEMLQVEYSLAATPYTLFCQRTEVLAVDNYRQKLSCSVCT